MKKLKYLRGPVEESRKERFFRCYFRWCALSSSVLSLFFSLNILNQLYHHILLPLVISQGIMVCTIDFIIPVLDLKSRALTSPVRDTSVRGNKALYMEVVMALTTWSLDCLALFWLPFFHLAAVTRLARLLATMVTEKRRIRYAASRLLGLHSGRVLAKECDLNLSFITPFLVASAVPCSVYNITEEVEGFLRDVGHGHYLVCNLLESKERWFLPYDMRGETHLCPMEDHNPTTLEALLSLANRVRGFLTSHSDGVVLVHCKAGKGRTGLVCAILLLDLDFCQDHIEALSFFRSQRGNPASDSFQGVTNPSQERYTRYFSLLMAEGRMLRPAKPVVISKIEVFGSERVGLGSFGDFTIAVDRGGSPNAIYEAVVAKGLNCDRALDPKLDAVRITLHHCPVLYKDVRVKFWSPSVKKRKCGCAFFFWFNTSYEDGVATFRREDLDNLGKDAGHDEYPEDFALRVYLEEV